MAKLKDGFYKLTAEAIGSDSYMLLAGGGSKALSDFATASGVVTALGTNGNYVTWTKNGAANNLTVPYATLADSANKLITRFSFGGGEHKDEYFYVGSITLKYAWLGYHSIWSFIGGETAWSGLLYIGFRATSNTKGFSGVTLEWLSLTDSQFNNSVHLTYTDTTETTNGVTKDVRICRIYIKLPSNYKSTSVSVIFESGTLEYSKSLVSTYEGTLYGTSTGNKAHIATSATNADTVDGYHVGLSNGSVSIYVSFPGYTTLKTEGFISNNYGVGDYGYPLEEFLQGICKWAILTYPNRGIITLMGVVSPSSAGTCILNLYSSHGKDSTSKLPRYCRGQFLFLNGDLVHFGTNEYVWSYNGFALYSDLKNPTNYYWANVKISDVSSEETTPTFATATATTSVATPLVSSTGRLTLNATDTGLDLKFNNDNTKSVILNGSAFKPFDAANNKLTLGSDSSRWSDVYSVKGNFTGLTSIRKDLGGNLSDWIDKLHNGPLEVGRSTNTMCVAIGVTDDDYGYIQCKGNNITSTGNLVLQPSSDGKLYATKNLYTILHTGNSSVSGGGNLGGSSITVNIGGTSKTLTIPTSLPANGGNADTLDDYHASDFESYKCTVIDTTELDENTWYPVTFYIEKVIQTRVRVEGITVTTGSWNTRSDKCMAVLLDYVVQGSGYGWITPTRIVYNFALGAGATGSNCVAGLGLLTNSSTEYVYVRGGAKYNFYISRFITPVLRTESYTKQNQTVAPTTTSPTAISRTNALKSNLTWSNITGKPSFAAVATSGSYNDLSNKPTIPTVGNGTVTIKQGETTKGSFTMNQSGNTTIELTANTTYELATSNTLGLVKIGYEANAKNYPIELNDDGLMYVNVPWEDDNTWRTVQCNGTSIGNNTLNLKAGSNITLSNTNGAITIASTNTWRSITDDVTTTNSDVSASATAVKTAYDKAVSAYNLANGKTDNTGTVTKVSTGTGLTGGDITSTGTIKCNLASETSLGTLNSTSKLYAVGVDANGKLCVNVPWSSNSYTFTNKAATLSWGETTIIATVGGTNITVKLPSNPNTDTNVTQTDSNTTADYRVLLSGSATDTSETTTSYKSRKLKFNPGTGTMSVGGIYSEGALYLTGVNGIIAQKVIKSTVADGIKPMEFISKTKVDNLNADMVDGYNIWTGTRALYTSATKNNNTIYLIHS